MTAIATGTLRANGMAMEGLAATLQRY